MICEPLPTNLPLGMSEDSFLKIHTVDNGLFIVTGEDEAKEKFINYYIKDTVAGLRHQNGVELHTPQVKPYEGTSPVIITEEVDSNQKYPNCLALNNTANVNAIEYARKLHADMIALGNFGRDMDEVVQIRNFVLSGGTVILPYDSHSHESAIREFEQYAEQYAKKNVSNTNGSIFNLLITSVQVALNGAVVHIEYVEQETISFSEEKSSFQS